MALSGYLVSTPAVAGLAFVDMDRTPPRTRRPSPAQDDAADQQRRETDRTQHRELRKRPYDCEHEQDPAVATRLTRKPTAIAEIENRKRTRSKQAELLRLEL